MCTGALANIASESCPSASGVQLPLLIGFAADVQTIPVAVNHVVSALTMVATKTFFRLMAAKSDTNSVAIESNENGYTVTATYYISKQSAAKSLALNALNNNSGIIAVVMDRNGNQTLLGSLSEPCVGAVSANTSPNGYTVTITWDTPTLPYQLTTAPAIAA